MIAKASVTQIYRLVPNHLETPVASERYVFPNWLAKMTAVTV